MRILHTGDWHIGKVVNDYSLLDDQKYIFKQFFDILEEQKPDVIIIAGDIYDRSIPPKEAVELLDEVLTKIVIDYHIPMLIVTGNHDSQERLSFGNKLLRNNQLYIEGLITEDLKKVTLKDEIGPVNFYLLPYAHPVLIKNIFNETVNNHQEAFKVLINRIMERINLSERNILITHNYVVSDVNSILSSESERSLSIGGTEYVDASLIEDFDYVALGHLHQYQLIKGEKICYSGSLLKYSFSEANRSKGVVMIDLQEKGHLKHQFIKLNPLKDMVVIEGKLNELTSPHFYGKIKQDDYICAKLTDTTDLYDPLSALRAIYPNIMQIQRNNLITNLNSPTKASGNFKIKSKLALFTEFYENIVGQNLDDHKINVLTSVINEVNICD